VLEAAFAALSAAAFLALAIATSDWIFLGLCAFSAAGIPLAWRRAHAAARLRGTIDPSAEDVRALPAPQLDLLYRAAVGVSDAPARPADRAVPALVPGRGLVVEPFLGNARLGPCPGRVRAVNPRHSPARRTGMRGSIVVAALFGAVTLGGAARAAEDLDAPKADAKHHKVEFENEWVRVIRAVIPPHEKTALHDHPSLVSVILTDADLRITSQDGKVSEVHAKKGSATWRGPTVPAHVAENMGDKPYEQIIVEPKGPPNPAWKPPPRDISKVSGADKVEFENEYVRIVRATFRKGDRSPMHDHPTNVQIALDASHVKSTSPDGKTTEVRSKAGEVRFRPPSSHAVEVLDDGHTTVIVDLKNAPATPK
jgi:quercetin dioxygenase-like cupin family protein